MKTYDVQVTRTLSLVYRGVSANTPEEAEAIVVDLLMDDQQGGNRADSVEILDELVDVCESETE